MANLFQRRTRRINDAVDRATTGKRKKSVVSNIVKDIQETGKKVSNRKKRGINPSGGNSGW